MQKFHWADYLIFSLSLAMSLAIGVYISFRDRHRSNTEEFLMGGRSMNFLPVAFSICASLINGIFIIGVPAEIYYYGPVFSTWLAGAALQSLAVSFIFIPTFHRMKITSAYEASIVPIVHQAHRWGGGGRPNPHFLTDWPCWVCRTFRFFVR